MCVFVCVCVCMYVSECVCVCVYVNIIFIYHIHKLYLSVYGGQGLGFRVLGCVRLMCALWRMFSML